MHIKENKSILDKKKKINGELPHKEWITKISKIKLNIRKEPRNKKIRNPKIEITKISGR